MLQKRAIRPNNIKTQIGVRRLLAAGLIVLSGILMPMFVSPQDAYAAPNDDCSLVDQQLLAIEFGGSLRRYSMVNDTFVDAAFAQMPSYSHASAADKANNLLFIAMEGEVHKLNLTTGAFIASAIPNPMTTEWIDGLHFYNGTLYVYTDGVIYTMDPDTMVSTPLISGTLFGASNGIEVRPDGMLYVINTGNWPSAIERYNPITGAFIDVFATSPHPRISGGWRDFAFGLNNDLFVALGDSQVARFNATTGAYIDDFHNSGAGTINAMVTDPLDGELYLSYGGPAALKKVITFGPNEGDETDIPVDFEPKAIEFLPVYGCTVSIGNFVWQDGNNDGIVNGSESSWGFNGVTVNLYDQAADANSNNQLSAAEIAAATPVATTTTANDTRPGPTNGRPGYYSFLGLEEGEYFVQIEGSNFDTGGPLETYTNSPTPPGVGDTHADNRDHGSIPAGGTLINDGVVSVAIDLQLGAEPTSSSGNPDDDAFTSSDFTIDFGFWHPYSLGNRVWLDLDNSASINGIDGITPGIAGVTVNLLNGSGSFITSTTTDADGYYRFDNLNAGNYLVEIPASNFGSGQPLDTLELSSIAAAESNNPNDNTDSNDDGINPANLAQAVRSGVVGLGPFAVEPTSEPDLGPGGQGTDDEFANMTVDFGFIEPPYKGDTVYFDLDGDAVQDANEPGIPNVTVRLIETATATLVETVVTNSQGRYLFNNFLPGTYTVEVDVSSVPGGNPTTPTSFDNAPVGPSEAILTDDFGFNEAGMLGNQIWYDINNNGIFESGETGIADVTVDLYQDINGNCTVDPLETLLGTTSTDSSGIYQFLNLLTDDNISGNGAGAQYLVRVTDTNGRLAAYTHVLGSSSGSNDNSQDPNGYCMSLTTLQTTNLTGDFGYYVAPNIPDSEENVESDDNNNLAETGQNFLLIEGLAVALIIGTVIVVRKNKSAFKRAQ